MTFCVLSSEEVLSYDNKNHYSSREQERPPHSTLGPLGAAGRSEPQAWGSEGSTAPKHPSSSSSSDPWLSPCPSPDSDSLWGRGSASHPRPQVRGKEKSPSHPQIKVRVALWLWVSNLSFVFQDMDPNSQNVDLNREGTQGSRVREREMPLMEQGTASGENSEDHRPGLPAEGSATR